MFSDRLPRLPNHMHLNSQSRCERSLRIVIRISCDLLVHVSLLGLRPLSSSLSGTPSLRVSVVALNHRVYPGQRDPFNNYHGCLISLANDA